MSQSRRLQTQADTPDNGLEPARSLLGSSSNWPSLASLSPRESEIARLVAKDLTNKEIAAVLELSIWTVSTHLRRMFAKLDVHSKAGLVGKVLELVNLSRLVARNPTEAASLANDPDDPSSGLPEGVVPSGRNLSA